MTTTSTRPPWIHMASAFDDALHMMRGRFDGSIKSLKTPWSNFDDVGIDGIEWNAMYVIAARPGIGKALSLDTPIPTPTGWTTMGDLKVNDEVIGMDGKPTKVTFITDIMYDRKCYDVLFSDGTIIKADAEHLWYTETRASRRAEVPPGNYVYKPESPYSKSQKWKNEKPSVKNTEEILRTLKCADGRLNHSIPVTQSFMLPDADLPFDPYLLGYWLGDGDSHDSVLSTGDQDIEHLVDQIEQTGYYYTKRKARTCWRVRISPTVIKLGNISSETANGKLRALGVIKNKHIPQQYLRASEKQRRDLLAGLLDSDGTINKNGRICFEVTNKQLADDCQELIHSLGYQTFVNTKIVKGRTEGSSVCYRVGFVANEPVFRLQRKNDRISVKKNPRTIRRFIVDIIPVESVPVRCITVDNEDHMYLASRSCIPTHNTLCASNITREAHRLNPEQDFCILNFQFEMVARNTAMREFSSVMKKTMKELHNADRGKPLKKTDIDQAEKYASMQRGRQEYIVETALTPNGIKRTVIQFYEFVKKPILITIDHSILVAKDATEKDKLETLYNLGAVLTELKRSLPVTFIVLSQLNRTIDDAERHEKAGSVSNYPTEADIFGSDALLQHADVVCIMMRPSKYHLAVYGPDKFIITDKNLLAFHFVKVRNGSPRISFFKADYENMTILETTPPPQEISKPRLR